VTGGHFVQRVDYTVNYRSVEGAYDDCYVMQYQDDGDATFNLSFDPGAPTRIVNRPSQLSFEDAGDSTLHHRFPTLSGVAARHWRGAADAEPGPDAGSSSCESFSPPDPPSQDTSGCGSEALQSWKSGMDLLRVGPGQLDTKPFGPVLQPDPFSPCPSDSLYGLSAATAVSKVGRRQLLEADRGETVRLSGQGEWSTNEERDFFIPFQFTSGEQHLRQEWELQLVKVRCGLRGCDDGQLRFGDPPEAVERKMKRAAQGAKELKGLEPPFKVFATVGGTKARQAMGADRGGHVRLGLVCGHRVRGKRREVAGAFLEPHRHGFRPVTYAGALEEARVTCEEAPRSRR
jgi:hypothetical protein